MEKTEVSGIFRTENGALVNKNNIELISYKRKKEDIKTITLLKSKVETLEKRLMILEELVSNFKH